MHRRTLVIRSLHP